MAVSLLSFKFWFRKFSLQFRVFLFLALLIPFAYAGNQQPNYYRNFWNPMYLGQRLAYCLLDNTGCGACVADRYCQSLGYEKASKQTIDYNVGMTHYLFTHSLCKGWTCNGFKLIRCAGKLTHKPPKAYFYREREYALPRYAHYRIDWCYENGRGCGRRAAYSFCRRMGYLKAKRFTQQKHVAATRAIGNQKLCFGDHCNAFSHITCYR